MGSPAGWRSPIRVRSPPRSIGWRRTASGGAYGSKRPGACPGARDQLGSRGRGADGLRVAWFTPVRDGAIAEYSRGVLAAMIRLCEPRLFCDGPPARFPAGIPVTNLTAEPQALSELPSFDAVFYNFGNDFRQHAWIFEVARLHPGNRRACTTRACTTFFLDYYVQHLARPDLYISRMAEHDGIARTRGRRIESSGPGSIRRAPESTSTISCTTRSPKRRCDRPGAPSSIPAGVARCAGALERTGLRVVAPGPATDAPRSGADAERGRALLIRPDYVDDAWPGRVLARTSAE